MNRKRVEVARFIERDILDAIESGLATLSAAQHEEAEAQYREALRALEAEVADEYPIIDAKGDLTAAAIAAGGRTIRQLRKDFLEAKQVREDARLSADLEAQVYNDLYRFFARYYDDGDFIPLRRYGADDKYAVPYNGEEVMLHWANADQYYVKSGEYFTDYRFHLAGTLAAEPAQVLFKLTAATVAQNNVKGEKRFFVLAAGAPVAWDAEGRALTVAFEYRTLTDDEKRRMGTQKQQEKLNAEAGAAILRLTPEPSMRSRMAAAEGDAKPGDERTALARHLAHYTARNTRDYFIHKDLGRFLERELDFFLGNEVLRVDDISWSQPSLVRRYVLRVQTIREIGRKIIAFLAQIEDFQRRLWEKRKFVVQSDYCATLDRVPPNLYPEIAANSRQRGEWARLYGLELGVDADLSNHPYAMVDTAFFDAGFKARLLAAFDDLDAACDGVLVHGENYQALSSLLPRYRNSVKRVYIDPPYNTGSDGFPYKDEFQHASWLAMMDSRLRLAQAMLAGDGTIFVSIDDHEVDGLRYLLDAVFEPPNFIAQLVWEKGRKNDAKLFSVGHEYMTVYARSMANLRALGTVWREPKPGAQEIWSQYIRLRAQCGDDDAAIEADLQAWYRDLPKDHPSKALSRYKHIDKFGPWRDRDISWPGGGGPRYEVIHPRTGKPCKIPEAGWRFAAPEAMQRQIRLGLVVFREGHTEPPFRKAHLRPVPEELDEENGGYVSDDETEEAIVGMQVMPSVLYKQSQVAVKYLRNLMGTKAFDNPKDHEVLARLLGYCTVFDRGDIVLDFFAGSGTTAHSVMTLNRQDKGNRKYLLVEMADYFDTVLKPRIQKVAYAADWRDGKPVAGSPGQSHMFHYLRLESYEDTLNNLHFRSLDGPLFAALDAMPDYLLHYMLDYETAGSPSLLDVAQFERPFAYQLNITRHDVTEPRTIDLVATFNFLLGLRVRTIRRFEREGAPIVRVTGEDPAGRRVCVLWRDVPPLEEMEAEKAWLQAEALAGVAYDRLYINGESALPGSGVLAIEPEFKRLMFEGIR